MKKFRDSTGHEWTIALPFGEIERVKEESNGKFDLLDAMKGKLYERLMNDPREFWELLAYLVTPQFDEAKITAKEFGLRMGADCLINAQLLFVQEWKDFFQLLQRHEIAEALDKVLLLHANAIALVQKRIQEDTTLKDLPAQAMPAMNRTLDKSFSDLRATLASILNPTPGEPSTNERKESDTNSAA